MLDDDELGDRERHRQRLAEAAHFPRDRAGRDELAQAEVLDVGEIERPVGRDAGADVHRVLDAVGPGQLEIVGEEALGLGLLAAERLHDERAIDRLVRDARHLADPLLRPLGGTLHPACERPVHKRERREDQDAEREQVRVGDREHHQRERHEEDDAGRERHGVQDVDRGLDVGLHVREELAGRRLPVVGERQIPVPVGHPVAQARPDGRPEHAAEVPADPDPHRPDGREAQDRRHGQPHGGRADPARERRADHAVRDAPERHRHRDRAHGEHERAHDRDGERPRMGADVGQHQTHAAAEQPARLVLRKHRRHAPYLPKACPPADRAAPARDATRPGAVACSSSAPRRAPALSPRGSRPAPTRRRSSRRPRRRPARRASRRRGSRRSRRVRRRPRRGRRRRTRTSVAPA